MKVNIIGKNNGVGLSQDTAIISDLLKYNNIEVATFDYDKNIQKADINIHLEHLQARHFRYAGKNIFIPNQEWIEDEEIRQLYNADAIFCKTREALRIFLEMKLNAVFTSFTSEDMYLPNESKYGCWIHVKGASSFKNSEVIYNVFKNPSNTEFLLFISDYYEKSTTHIIKHSRIDRMHLKKAMNQCLFHLCPSEAEGFGHYINEARSTGAVIISTDAPPMNELIQEHLIKPVSHFKQCLGERYQISEKDLKEMIEKVRNTSKKELIRTGELNRKRFLENDKFFKFEFMKQINKIL